MQRILPKAFPSTSSTLSASTVPFYVDRRPPPDLGKWANFKRFIWNKEKRTFCNRTCLSWTKILLFYTAFIVIMLGIFLILMFGYTSYITNNYKLAPWIPKQDLIINATPGLAFFPNILKTHSPLIWYTSHGKQSPYNMKYEIYVKHINAYFRQYDNAEKNLDTFRNCDHTKDSNKSCLFLRKHMGLCGGDHFGYKDKKPCFFVKLNKLPGWKPEYFQGDDLPPTMPNSLKEVIRNDISKKKVYLHCEGMQPSDREHAGKFTYYPHQGFDGFYFPYLGQKDYLTPLVAVKVNNIKEGYVVNIKCSIWAKNIKYDNEKQHSTYIQLYLAMD